MEQITYDNGFGQRLNSYKDSVDLSAYFEQAKAMHKEEIVDTFMDSSLNFSEGEANKYYNETFIKNKQRL